MSKKLEQVALAIKQAATDFDGVAATGDAFPIKANLRDIAIARAAVEAMRDPSQRMRIAGHSALVESEACAPDLGHQIGFGALGDAWRAMIDTALSPPLAHGEASEVRDDR